METEIYLKLSEAVDKFVEANARGFTTDQIVHFLNRLPKYEVPEIVHCEECKHGIAETGSRFPFEGNVTCKLDHVKRQWFKEDFCSYGEAREKGASDGL